MKQVIVILNLLLIGFISAAQEKRNSENYYERINFNQLSASSLKISSYINIHSASRTVADKNLPARFIFSAKKIELKKITPFLSFSCGWNELNDEIENSFIAIRFSADSSKWNDWIELKTDEHYEKGIYTTVSQLLYLEKEMRYYQLKISSNQNRKGNILQHLFLNFFSPGEKPQQETLSVQPVLPPVQQRVTACSCPQPSFVNRSGWNCPQSAWNPTNTSVTHLIVHHSAGGNTSSDWGAVVLSIWNFHTGTNGYSDIGYNWLIAPDGTVYEGRYKSSTEDISGAHFCGFNGNTMGVCMMGTYTSQTITAAAKNSLVRLLAWKACQRSIDPTAVSFHASSNTTINNVSGHRQGCATECPGTLLFADLPGIRAAIQSYSDNGCTLTAVAAIDGLEEFSISPNPANGVVLIKLKLNSVKKIQYNVLAADGKLIYSSPEQTATGMLVKEVTAFRSLPKATYYIQLRVNEKVITKQIIMQ